MALVHDLVEIYVGDTPAYDTKGNVDKNEREKEAADGGQMRLCLKRLIRYERQEHENEPVVLILCATGSRVKIELMEMDKDGIVVAEYWTKLPPKKEFEQKIHTILAEAKNGWSDEPAMRYRMVWEAEVCSQ
jgi:hypothetical protein